MKLRVVTPTEVMLEQDAVHVTVEDATGSLGIRAGHAPLVTALVPGIVTARGSDGRERHVAVNGGVLLMDGETLQVVSRSAVVGDDFRHLEETVVQEFEKEASGDRANRVAFEKMRVQFMRGVLDFEGADAL